VEKEGKGERKERGRGGKGREGGGVVKRRKRWLGDEVKEGCYR
jgi:hypothetical protein